MKAIIFGAGASFDSVNEYYEPENPFNLSGKSANYEKIKEFYDSIEKNSWKPPLANQLFSSRIEFKEILDRYPGAKSLASLARHRGDIEVFLDEIKIEVETHYNPELFAKFINIQFYLQELLGCVSENYLGSGYSNYEALLHNAYNFTKSTKENVALISFNYDTLLESIVERVANMEFKTINDYISGNLRVYKPHGSVNWFIPLNHSTEQKDIYLPDYLYKNIHLYPQLFPLNQDDILIKKWDFRGQVEPNNSYSFHMPQIALPLVSKNEFLFPNSHLQQLKNDLRLVDEILVIGWRASETKFLDLLNQTIGNRKVAITYVCCDTNEPIDNLTKSIPNQEVIRYKEKFFINSKDDRSFEVHAKGSFSSYIRNVNMGRWINFFKKKEVI